MRQWIIGWRNIEWYIANDSFEWLEMIWTNLVTLNWTLALPKGFSLERHPSSWRWRHMLQLGKWQQRINFHLLKETATLVKVIGNNLGMLQILIRSFIKLLCGVVHWRWFNLLFAMYRRTMVISLHEIKPFQVKNLLQNKGSVLLLCLFIKYLQDHRKLLEDK